MIEPQHQSVSCLSATGFHRMSYTEWGSGPRTIVCVHGLTRNGRDFDRLAAALSQRLTARVICPSVVGRGTSDWLRDSAGYGYPQYLADMTVLLARLDVDSVDWVGSSMGGLIGMMLAAQPGNPIRRLVLNDVGPFVFKSALETIRDYIGGDPRFETVAELETYLREIYAAWGPMTDDDWTSMAKHTARVRPDASVGLAYDPGIAVGFQVAALDDVDLWSLWNRVSCPVLTIRGVLSELLTAEVAGKMTETGPKARLVEIPGFGHCPSLMDDEQIDLVSDFLA
jgi:pimeloyl-ACP methyl ester carboxylesterase